jgi:hypothetical protein
METRIREDGEVDPSCSDDIYITETLISLRSEKELK